MILTANRLATAFATSVVAVAALLSAPSGAVGAGAASTVRVSGTFVVVEDIGRTADAGALPPRTGARAVLYPAGSLDAIPLASTPDGARSGDRITALLPLSATVARRLGVGAGARVAAASPTGTAALHALVSSGDPIRPVATAVERRAAPDVAASTAHTSQIAIVRPVKPHTTTPIAADDVPASTVLEGISRAEQYWVDQSSGAISGWSESPVQTYDSTLDCSDVNGLWAEAAEHFGDPSGTSWLRGRSRHLIVIVPSACAAYSGIGLGTIGSGVPTGGLVLASYDADVLTPTIAHELGHNFGLAHAFVRLCDRPSAGIEAGTCTRAPYEYLDPYSVMGGAWGGYSEVPALSALLRHHLHFDQSGSRPELALPGDAARVTDDITLTAAGVGGGETGVQLTDPYSGATYDVSYRDGSGQDAGAAYTGGLPGAAGGGRWTTGRGVVIEQGVDDEGAFATDRFAVAPDPGSPSRSLALTAGQSVSTVGSGVSISVHSVDGTEAAVHVVVGTWTRSGEPPVVDRLAGADRYETAVRIAQAGFPDSAPVVYLASGRNFPDALSAAPAATREGGPLLLTDPDALPDAVRAELVALRPSRVVVVGGEQTVGAGVVRQLAALPGRPSIVRVAGADRYATSRAIVEYAFGAGGASSVYIATGADYPDALSAGAAAGSEDDPVLLVPGSAATADRSVLDLIGRIRPGSLVVVGGTASVSASIASSLGTRTGLTVKRFAGDDRFQTAIAVDRAVFPAPSTAYVASGLGFADALGGAGLAGVVHAPLYVARAECIPAGALDDVAAADVSRVTMLGGPVPLSPTGAGQLRSCG